MASLPAAGTGLARRAAVQLAEREWGEASLGLRFCKRGCCSGGARGARPAGREAGGWALPFDRPRATAELKWPRFADAQPDIGRDKGGAKGKLGGASLFKGGSDGAQGQNKIKV